ncbi:hypothetical protein ACFY8F_35270 [Streptomyces tanashiensis]|uniref:hypothetical protein n=1 Tax=Streptomyces tanashiensis TaxID=67367 RepID=UPI00367EDB06
MPLRRWPIWMGIARRGVVLLLGIARDGGVQVCDRITATSTLAECGEERSVELLSAWAADPTVPSDARVLAARSFAVLDGHRAADVRFLAALANDPQADRGIGSTQRPR